jgi:ParB family chromosome partitioning protein
LQSIPISNIQTGIIENISVSQISGLVINGTLFNFRSQNKDNFSNDFELCDSIQRNGLLVPIIVRFTTRGNFEVISGNRRIRAFKKLGLRKILCHIVYADDKKAIEILLSENIHSRQIDPIEEATIYKKYVEEFGWGGVTDLAKKISKSVSYVDRRIKYLDLEDDLKEEIRSGMVKPCLADELITIKNDEKRSTLIDLIRKRSPSLREFRRICKNESLVVGDFCFNSTNKKMISKMVNDKEKASRSYEQAIMAFRISLDKLSSIINNLEDDWLIHEFLMEHKRALHKQIDILYREKKKLNH